LTQALGAPEPATSNTTSALSEDDVDELLANMDLATFKERYRRLIPYMTFYVANNYLQNQAALGQNYAKEELSSSTVPRKPPQPPLIRLGGIPTRGGNKYRAYTLPNQEKKFIPSVQFDPRNIGGDNDYFTPVKYANKITYVDYSSPSYQLYQTHKVYPDITTPSSQILYKDNRYFAIDRPLQRPLAPMLREQHPFKKPLIGHQSHNNYEQDYGIKRPPSVSYANEDFESPRYVQPLLRQFQQQPVKPSAAAHLHRKPNLNLYDVISGYQAEQLPEIPDNNGNIDDNIKTLVEILNILHNTRQEEFPQPQRPPLLPLPPSPPPRLVNYNGYKPKTYTRPKVITETRFQVTPNPLLITDDPERYKTTDDDAADEVADEVADDEHSDYDVDDVKDKKVEYYVPYVPYVSNEHEQAFRPTPPTEHSYEITEDLSDDISQDERYTLPISTEASSSKGYVAQNEVTDPKPKVPQTSLKYGATRGKPHIDYPAYAVIPETNFTCKDQRYKGFFGDPATRCQVSQPRKWLLFH